MGDVITGHSFATFWPSLPGPGRQPNGPLFWLKFFLESRLSSESLEHLIDFLAYLEPKLWLKNQNFVKNYTPTNADHGYIIPILYMALTRQQIELEICSTPL